MSLFQITAVISEVNSFEPTLIVSAHYGSEGLIEIKGDEHERSKKNERFEKKTGTGN